MVIDLPWHCLWLTGAMDVLPQKEWKTLGLTLWGSPNWYRLHCRNNPSNLKGGEQVCLFTYWTTVNRHGRSAHSMPKIKQHQLGPGLRVPGMALLGCRPFGPSLPRSAFPFRFRNVLHPSVHSSLTTAVGNRHGSQG
ncbi:MAG: hypothetical protein P8N49_02820 [Opitutales bacterium]|nr:hypothetical protein [Opitutales bacterium]